MMLHIFGDEYAGLSQAALLQVNAFLRHVSLHNNNFFDPGVYMSFYVVCMACVLVSE
jgi:hypothetical protein